MLSFESIYQCRYYQATAIVEKYNIPANNLTVIKNLKRYRIKHTQLYLAYLQLQIDPQEMIEEFQSYADTLDRIITREKDTPSTTLFTDVLRERLQLT